MRLIMILPLLRAVDSNDPAPDESRVFENNALGALFPIVTDERPGTHTCVNDMRGDHTPL
jgi:hypothetical protein